MKSLEETLTGDIDRTDQTLTSMDEDIRALQERVARIRKAREQRKAEKLKAVEEA